MRLSSVVSRRAPSRPTAQALRHSVPRRQRSGKAYRVFIRIFLLIINYLPPVATFPVGEVQEAFAGVDDRLVERQATLAQDMQQVARPLSAIAVGRLASQVLIVGDASHQAVDFLAAIAAQDGDRLAEAFAQRVEQVFHQARQVLPPRLVGLVREAVFHREAFSADREGI